MAKYTRDIISVCCILIFELSAVLERIRLAPVIGHQAQTPPPDTIFPPLIKKCFSSLHSVINCDNIHTVYVLL